MFGGNPLTRGAIYKILGNRIYLGDAVHKGTGYPGEQQAIIDQALWDRVHETLDQNRVGHQRPAKAKDPSLLAGIIFDREGLPMTPRTR
ncbi:MAG: recombinase family protein [Sphingomonadales bacterium]